MQYLLALTFLLAPTFLFRFQLLGLPVNFLMLWIFIVWLIFAVWLVVKNELGLFITSVVKTDKKFFILIVLLFFAATVSLFDWGFTLAKFGQYIVLFLQPISVFFIARYLFKKFPVTQEYLIYAFYALLGVCGIYAVVQYQTLFGLPPEFWGNSIEPKRSLTFFAHPDAFALFITPLLGFLLPDVAGRLLKLKESMLNSLLPLAWLLGLVGLIYSLSRGGWLGFLAAAGVFVIVSANKKYIIGALCVILVAAGFIYYVPNFRYRVILPFYGQRSAMARFTVWDAGIKMIKENPILGKGITGYSQNFTKYTSDPSLEHHNYPHMIFLDFWVETGFLGMLAFAGVCFYALYYGFKNRGQVVAFGVLLFFIAMLAHGLVDNPYFQNDLALVFWLILGLIVV